MSLLTISLVLDSLVQNKSNSKMYIIYDIIIYELVSLELEQSEGREGYVFYTLLSGHLGIDYSLLGIDV